MNITTALLLKKIGRVEYMLEQMQHEHAEFCGTKGEFKDRGPRACTCGRDVRDYQIDEILKVLSEG